MSYKTIVELKKYENILSSNPILSQEIVKTEALFAEISETLQKQGVTSMGITKTKRGYRQAVDTDSHIFLGSIRSFAKSTDNVELYYNSKLSLWKIKRLKDSGIMSLSSTIKSILKKNLKQLEDYGVSQEAIDGYESKIANYIRYRAKPRTHIAERKTATASLKQLFVRLSAQFYEQIDNNMLQYLLKEPEFYNNYRNTRNIYDKPTRSNALMGKLVDEQTGKPLQYVKVSVSFAPESGEKDKYRTTTAKGNFLFKRLPTGVCKVSFDKSYYQSKVIDSQIQPNAMTRINQQLQKEKEEIDS